MKAVILFLSLACINLSTLGQNESAISDFNCDTLKAQIKLVKVRPTPPCGIGLWTTAQKFELLMHNRPFIPKRYLTVLQSCPEFLGKNFFQQGRIYEVVLVRATEDDGSKYTSDNERLPTYWCTRIRPSLNSMSQKIGLAKAWPFD
jgi:hypothetical protein